MDLILKNNSCEVINSKTKDRLITKGFGTKINKKYLLNLFEIKYISDKSKIKIRNINNKLISKKELLKVCYDKIKNFEDKYIVFKDLKDKGFIVKDGAIFGFDFRVYNKLKNKEHKHTEFVVDVKTTHKDTVTKLIKSERLANSINVKYIVAIVDQEKKIIKLKIERVI